jgi:hypothetical protein
MGFTGVDEFDEALLLDARGESFGVLPYFGFESFR